MKTENKNQLLEAFENYRFLSEYVDLNYILNYNDTNDLDELNDALIENINTVEIIYYSNAIKILSIEDPSLNESLEIAEEYGCTLKSIDSELLATLIIQQRCREDLNDFIDEIESLDLFEEEEN